MNQSRKVLLAALLSAGLATAGGLALAHGKSGWHGPESPRMERMVERLADRLDLEDSQRAAIRSIIEATLPALDDHRQALRENRQELRDLVRSETFDEAAVHSVAAVQGDLMAELVAEGTFMMRAIRDVLTPEQRAEVEQLIEKRMGRLHGRGWGVSPY